MAIFKKGIAACAVATLGVSFASAQSFNVDVGNSLGTPSAAYGGAAGQPGIWNTSAESLSFYSTSIVDLSGAPTSVYLVMTGAPTEYSTTSVQIADPDAAALMLDLAEDPLGSTLWTFSGLAGGVYDIYTYAWSPTSDSFVSSVSIDGGGAQSVGGNWPGSQVEGMTYALHTVDVQGGAVQVDVSTALAFSSVNGFQFVFVGSGPDTDICVGDGGDQQGCTPCPCSNDAPQGTTGGCLNSAGTSTLLTRAGSSSLLAADLRFEATGAPPQENCQLISGSQLAPNNPQNPCFGLSSGVQSVSFDGLRCVVQGVLRHGVRTSDANGDVGATTAGWGSPDGFFQFTAFVSGTVRHFQIVHRDDPAQVCGTGLNTSQAASVLFTL